MPGDNILAGGYAVAVSSSFTRPADTTAYAAGDLVANSTTAADVQPLSWTIARAAALGGYIRRVRLRKSGTSTTNASFRVHLFTATPTVANGDNGALSMSGSASYLGACDVTCDQTFTDGAAGYGVPNVGTEVVAVPTGRTVFGLVEARAAYTPASGETFAVLLEVMQN